MFIFASLNLILCGVGATTKSSLTLGSKCLSYATEWQSPWHGLRFFVFVFGKSNQSRVYKYLLID